MEYGIFAKNLKFYRKRRGLTQTSLGDKSGVGQVNIANYERGTRFPGEKTIIILAENLGISPDLLFSGYNLKQDISTNMPFNLKQLISLLLNNSLKECRAYINGWKKTNGLTLEKTFTTILIPLLKETGDKWQNGEISIWEEHLISAKIRELITLLSASENNSHLVDFKGNNVWMGFCAPSDKHDIVLFMLSQLLKNRGWKTYFVGTDMPINDLLSMAEKITPTVISISISMDLFQSGLDAYLQKIDISSDIDCPVMICGKGADVSNKLKYKKVSHYASTLIEGYDTVLGLEN